MLHLNSKTRKNVLIVWLVVFCSLYYIYNSQSELDAFVVQTPTESSSSVDLLSSYKLDAVVYIAMGRMAADTTLDYSIVSLRQLGKYTGPIFIITDSPDCFQSLISMDLFPTTTASSNKHTSYNSHHLNNDKTFIKTIVVPPEVALTKIKALKTQILKLVPTEYKSIVYLDVDILVTKPLHSFIYDTIKAIIITRQKWNKENIVNTHIPSTIKMKTSVSSPLISSSTISSKFSNNTKTVPHFFDIAAFLDASGHYVGFCDGCEKWHTGVLLYQREHGEACLKSWGEILLSGKYDTDQQSLDEAEKLGFCQTIIPFPKNHLLFAKDYIGWFLTSGHSFVHLTGAGRLKEQNYFYREIVVPRLRGSLHIPSALVKDKKICKIGTSTLNSVTSAVPTK